MNLRKGLLVGPICFLLGLVLLGCKKDPYMLAIMGYNYTDRAIVDFSVNGAWGGTSS